MADVFPVLSNINTRVLEALLSAEDGGQEAASADAANILAHRLTLETLYLCTTVCPTHIVPGDLQTGSPQSYVLCVSSGL